MDTFYDISSGELKELWETDLDSESISDAFERSAAADALPDWATGLSLHDRLMSEAALGGGAPIKSEHSYSLTSDGDSGPDSPLSHEASFLTRGRFDADLDDECFSCVPLESVTGRLRGGALLASAVKEEPLSEPASPASPVDPASPSPAPAPASPPSALPALSASSAAPASALSETKMCGAQQSVLKQQQPATATALVLTRGALLTAASTPAATTTRVVIPKLSIKLEGAAAAAAGFALPPTPPSSAGSDTEGNASPPHQSASASAMPSHPSR